MSKAETCVCCGRVIPENSHYCVICGMGIPKKQRQIDRIRNMSIDELAKFIPDWSYTKACKCDEEIYADCNNECWKCVKEWLESEVDAE